MSAAPDPAPDATPHRRRPRYPGRNPRRFEHKYKEHAKDEETLAKVRAAGKTPAGMHVPILLAEILHILAPRPGERAVDCTLGHGGHASALLEAGVALLGLDQDPLEIVRTTQRLGQIAGADRLFIRRMNFAGLRQALDEQAWSDGADLILADLGCSSMQFDNPARGFSFKHDGPLDMRMNPQRGLPARDLLQRLTPARLQALLLENADEPHAGLLASTLAGTHQPTTTSLAEAVRRALPARLTQEAREASIRRVFQALRIAVNEEFTALDTFLQHLPACLRPGGRVAILTFHSGEDRRVKHAFRDALRAGLFSTVSADVIRPCPEEIRANPRASPAKLRWAVRAAVSGSWPAESPGG